MIRYALVGAAFIVVVAVALQILKFYVRRFVRRGRVLAVFVPPPGRHAIVGFQFRVIGDCQISINLEGPTKKDDHALYLARPAEGETWVNLNTPTLMTDEQSIVVRRHFWNGTITGFHVVAHQVPEPGTEPRDPSEDYVSDFLNT